VVSGRGVPDVSSCSLSGWRMVAGTGFEPTERGGAAPCPWRQVLRSPVGWAGASDGPKAIPFNFEAHRVVRVHQQPRSVAGSPIHADGTTVTPLVALPRPLDPMNRRCLGAPPSLRTGSCCLDRAARGLSVLGPRPWHLRAATRVRRPPASAPQHPECQDREPRITPSSRAPRGP